MKKLVKDRMIYFIIKFVKKFDNRNFSFDTNEGKVVNIEGKNVTFKMKNNVFSFINLDNCKISTLGQIVDGLKCELYYQEIEKKIKNETNYFDDIKKEWTHKPINKKLLMEKIKLKLKSRKLFRNNVRLSNIKD